MMKVVIIGASFAGVHCAIRTKELHPYDEVVLIEQEKELGFLPSGLTLLMNGVIFSLDEATFTTKEHLLKKGIHLELGVRGIDFDFVNHCVETTKGAIYYDKLVLAMGSSQHSQKLISDHPGFLTYKKREQAQLAVERIKSSQKVAIIGAGQTGMELASSLVKQHKHVSLIESMSYPLYKSFDEDFLQPFLEKIAENDYVTTYFSQTVKDIQSEGLEDKVTLVSQQEEIRTDTAFLATNVRPDLSIFKGELAFHADQTIKVDAYFETSQPDVFAIGDLVQVPSLLLEQSIYLPLINNAVRSAHVCAENLETKTTPYHGAIRIIGTCVFDYYLASCGLTEADSFLYPGPVATLTLNFPLSTVEKEPVKIKFTYNKNTQVLLGVQMISKVNILEKINTYALAIDLEMSIQELAQKDYFYHPLFANPVADMIKLSQRG